jgi:hypothetical protein
VLDHMPANLSGGCWVGITAAVMNLQNEDNVGERNRDVPVGNDHAHIDNFVAFDLHSLASGTSETAPEVEDQQSHQAEHHVAESGSARFRSQRISPVSRSPRRWLHPGWDRYGRHCRGR